MNRQCETNGRAGRVGLRSHRSGFTLVELLMVVGIIAALAGLLLGGVFSAAGRVNVATTVADIKDIESALLAFKDKYGVYPPSALALPETSEDWVDADNSLTAAEKAAVQVSLRNLRQVFPQWNPPTADRDWNQDGAVTAGGIVYLNGSECLLFFLGGGRVSGTVPLEEQAYTGFSKNPIEPFTLGTTNREKPLFEIRTSRLVDVDGDNMPEYLDNFPDQQVPYVYFRAVRDGVYTPAGVDGALGTDDDETPPGGPAFAYYKSITDSDTSTPAVIDTTTIPTGIPWASGKFQLVSAGEDGVYGIGGIYNEGGSPAIPSESYDIGGTVLDRDPQVEQDNIASFVGGTLQ